MNHKEPKGYKRRTEEAIVADVTNRAKRGIKLGEELNSGYCVDAKRLAQITTFFSLN